MKETENTIVKHSNHNYQMFLRDQFANLAMQGVLASYDSQTSFDTFKHSSEDLARTSYIIADAMLKQREL